MQSNTQTDEWHAMIKAVDARLKGGEISSEEYYAFTKVVSRARSRGWTPEDMDFDPERFEEDLQRRFDDSGNVHLGPEIETEVGGPERY